MMGISLCILLGAASFQQQQIHGLEISNLNPYTGKHSTNFRQADVNKDGYTDLIFNNKIIIQRDGQFSGANTIDIPLNNTSTEIDIFNNNLYLKSDQALQVKADWTATLSEDVKLRADLVLKKLQIWLEEGATLPLPQEL